jgi:hypothetical protein
MESGRGGKNAMAGLPLPRRHGRSGAAKPQSFKGILIISLTAKDAKGAHPYYGRPVLKVVKNKYIVLLSSDHRTPFIFPSHFFP